MRMTTLVQNPFVCQCNRGTFKLIAINSDLINCNVDAVLKYADETFRIERNESGALVKLYPSNDVLNVLDTSLDYFTQKSLINTDDISDYSITLLKCLRNCTSTPEIQSYILLHTNVVKTTMEIFDNILNTRNAYYEYLKIPLQFLVNLISSNAEHTEMVYDLYKNYLYECLKKHIHIYECSAVIYNISRFHCISPNLVEGILDCFSNENDNEYFHFLMEHFINVSYFWNFYKQNLSTDNKLKILHFLREALLNSASTCIYVPSLQILSREFINSMSVVFQLYEEIYDQKSYQLISVILQILSACSGMENYTYIFQRNKDLFINSGVMLLNIHKLGKVVGNCFTPIQKLSDFNEDKLSTHPAFGFKADLIRLIGNMCWKNSEMQNLSRTAELIPVILDCCNMDAKNPFIIQWSILAIRNICDENLENQQIIADMHKKGAVSNDTLQEMGIKLHSDGTNTVSIVSFEDLKNT